MLLMCGPTPAAHYRIVGFGPMACRVLNCMRIADSGRFSGLSMWDSRVPDRRQFLAIRVSLIRPAFLQLLPLNFIQALNGS
jgi:hypothetical protein